MQIEGRKSSETCSQGITAAKAGGGQLGKDLEVMFRGVDVTESLGEVLTMERSARAVHGEEVDSGGQYREYPVAEVQTGG